ncbi:MAG TPA: hypothetical protein VNT99_17830 [Methylomirabilota bacterium]|nr:hypothetical protein [Methylomirabilota bacterium]
MKVAVVLSTWALTLITTLAVDASKIPVTGEVEGITTDRADFKGSLLQLRHAGRLGFQWRTVGKRTWSRTTWQRSSPFNPPGITFTDTIANLKFDTDYEVRAVAIVRGSRRHGNIVTFHSSTGSPEFISSATTNISSSNAVITASFYPNAAPTLARFEWGTTTNYGNVTEAVSYAAGVAPQTVAAGLEALLPDFTTYHWRLVASNASGILVSPDAAFIATDYVGIPEGYSWTFSSDLPYVGRITNMLFSQTASATFSFLPGSFSPNGALFCEMLPHAPAGLITSTTVNAPSEGGSLYAGGPAVTWGNLRGSIRFTAQQGSVVLTNLAMTYEFGNGFSGDRSVYGTNIDLRMRP